MGTLQSLVEHFTYVGMFALLLLAGFGLPIPEEMPVAASGVLAHQGVVRWWIALPVCLAGILSADVLLYWVGRHWGEQVLGWRRVRTLLPRERAEQLKAAYRRHTVKTVVAARHLVGIRAAAFLSAGIARVPFARFLVADAAALLLGPCAVFGLAYLFTNQLHEVLADARRVERWLVLAAVVAVVIALGVAARRRSRPAEIAPATPDKPGRGK
jgi:membrane protein DedA with SNARE-associated domain